MPLAGTVFAYAAAAIFFAMGGAHDLIALWAASLDALPLGHGLLAGDVQALSALMGTLQMLIGTLAMAAVGLFASDAPLPMVVGMATGALVGVALTWITLGRVHRVAHD